MSISSGVVDSTSGGWVLRVDEKYRHLVTYYGRGRLLFHLQTSPPLRTDTALSPLNLLYENCPVLFDYILPPWNQFKISTYVVLSEQRRDPGQNATISFLVPSYFVTWHIWKVTAFEMYWTFCLVIIPRATSKSPAFYRPIDAFYCQYTLRIIQKCQEIIP